MKVWISKYAISDGKVTELEVEECVTSNDLVCHRAPGQIPQYFHGEGKEWHRTREGAVGKAEEMVDRKLASLRKQIKKIEALKF